MTQTIKQKCEAIGISLPTYYLRIKNGMTPEEALSTPNKRHSPKSTKIPQQAPEPEDQEPRAPMIVKCGGGTSCVFKEDFQKRFRKLRMSKPTTTAPLERPEKSKPRSYVAELGDRYRTTQKKKVKVPAPSASPIYHDETEKVDNYEYVNRKPLYYGPIHNGVQAKTPMPWNEKDEAKFNQACGGYTAAILNHTKEGEFKYQIYSTNTKKKLYTNDIVRFINQIIKICDPEGKTPFRVIER